MSVEGGERWEDVENTHISAFHLSTSMGPPPHFTPQESFECPWLLNQLYFSFNTRTIESLRFQSSKFLIFFIFFYYASKECDNVYMCQMQNPMDQTYMIYK